MAGLNINDGEYVSADWETIRITTDWSQGVTATRYSPGVLAFQDKCKKIWERLDRRDNPSFTLWVGVDRLSRWVGDLLLEYPDEK